jgi:hypothetical protein
MSEWTLTLTDRPTGEVDATITLDSNATVTTTGAGERIVPIIVVGPNGQPLRPADGLPWLVALAEEMGRSGYTVATIEGPGAPDWG